MRTSVEVFGAHQRGEIPALQGEEATILRDLERMWEVGEKIGELLVDKGVSSRRALPISAYEGSSTAPGYEVWVQGYLATFATLPFEVKGKTWVLEKTVLTHPSFYYDSDVGLFMAPAEKVGIQVAEAAGDQAQGVEVGLLDILAQEANVNSDLDALHTYLEAGLQIVR